jgi:hypothetical protein
VLRLRPLRRDLENGSKVGGSSEGGDAEQVAAGISHKLANRFPAVIRILKLVKHRLAPPDLCQRRRGEPEHDATANISVNLVRAESAAPAEGRPVEIASCIRDQASLRACSLGGCPFFR